MAASPCPSTRTRQAVHRFKRCVADDFKDTRQDLQAAFRPPSRVSGCPPAQAMVGLGEAVAATGGVLAAARKLPLRATRLLAETVADATGFPSRPADAGASEEPSAETAPSEERAQPPAEAEQAATPNTELKHFLRYVADDFDTARGEIRQAFGAFGAPVREESVEDMRQASHALPAAMSAVAGVTVAATMLPLRAVRLGIAAGRTATVGAPSAAFPGGARSGAPEEAIAGARAGAATEAGLAEELQGGGDADVEQLADAAGGEEDGASALESFSTVQSEAVDSHAEESPARPMLVAPSAQETRQLEVETSALSAQPAADTADGSFAGGASEAPGTSSLVLVLECQPRHPEDGEEAGEWTDVGDSAAIPVSTAPRSPK